MLLTSLSSWAQTTTTGHASTTKPCSVANTGSNNKIQIDCGISKDQAQKMLAILNKILADQLDLDTVLKDVEQIRAQQEFSGFLSPADEASPDNACADPLSGKRPLPPGMPPPLKGGFLLIVGGSAAYATDFPVNVIKINADNLVVLDSVDGQIAVSAKRTSRDGRIVAELKRNQWFVNPNNYFRKEHPDKHSLVVFDQEGVEVLNVRFINRTTIRLLGVLYYPGGALAISEKDGPLAAGNCISDPGGVGAA